MIQLTRLNNTRLAVNCDLIKYVEEAPDTVITLLNGEKLVVRETTAEVIDCVRRFRRSILSAASDAILQASHAGGESRQPPTHSAVSNEGPVCG
jgi:flagellar protein FlbD